MYYMQTVMHALCRHVPKSGLQGVCGLPPIPYGVGGGAVNTRHGTIYIYTYIYIYIYTYIYIYMVYTYAYVYIHIYVYVFCLLLEHHESFHPKSKTQWPNSGTTWDGHWQSHHKYFGVRNKIVHTVCPISRSYQMLSKRLLSCEICQFIF